MNGDIHGLLQLLDQEGGRIADVDPRLGGRASDVREAVRLGYIQGDGGWGASLILTGRGKKVLNRLRGSGPPE